MNPLCTPSARRTGWVSERGSATVFLVFLAVALLAGAGLVIDGGYALAARRTAMNQAEQSARVAADQLSVPGLRNGTVQVDPDRARTAALDYLHAAGANGQVLVQGDRVTVTVTGGDAERLYARLGWVRVGEVPEYALWPGGGRCATTFYHRNLA